MTLVSTAPRRPPAAAIGHLTSDLPSALAAGYVEERGGLPGAALPWGDRVLDSPREPVDRLGVFADRFKRARLAPASDIGMLSPLTSNPACPRSTTYVTSAVPSAFRVPGRGLATLVFLLLPMRLGVVFRGAAVEAQARRPSWRWSRAFA